MSSTQLLEESSRVFIDEAGPSGLPCPLTSPIAAASPRDEYSERTLDRYSDLDFQDWPSSRLSGVKLYDWQQILPNSPNRGKLRPTKIALSLVSLSYFLCWLYYSLPTKESRVSIPGRVTPGFPHVRNVPNDSAGRRVFSGMSCFPRPCIPALLHSRLVSPSSAVKTSMLRATQISSLAQLQALALCQQDCLSRDGPLSRQSSFWRIVRPCGAGVRRQRSDELAEHRVKVAVTRRSEICGLRISSWWKKFVKSELLQSFKEKRNASRLDLDQDNLLTANNIRLSYAVRHVIKKEKLPGKTVIWRGQGDGRRTSSGDARVYAEQELGESCTPPSPPPRLEQVHPSCISVAGELFWSREAQFSRSSPVNSARTKAKLGSIPAGGTRIFTCGKRGGGFRLPVGFLGSLPFPRPVLWSSSLLSAWAVKIVEGKLGSEVLSLQDTQFLLPSVIPTDITEGIKFSVAEEKKECISSYPHDRGVGSARRTPNLGNMHALPVGVNV
ncbi:hypothetical protein PR048_001359 [Dryococelus australis]|uniref:Uncharacterized protein n=1 Tax=Dryococelus australis TaxID=614101 RepID=A0ABQ9IJI9_9NEOP|nr:hypothetical protein PR048_001359 [Dryococelus australis]